MSGGLADLLAFLADLSPRLLKLQVPLTYQIGSVLLAEIMFRSQQIDHLIAGLRCLRGATRAFQTGQRAGKFRILLRDFSQLPRDLLPRLRTTSRWEQASALR